MKIVVAIAFLAVSVIAAYSTIELTNADKYRNELKSRVKALELSNDSLYNSIDSIRVIASEASKKANEYELKADSLTEYQNKIYVYYSNKLKEARSVPDSDVLGVFSGLLSE